MSRPTGDSPPRMRGATASVAGSRGIVPKPTAGQHTYMLLGDGTWGAQPIAGLPSQTSNSGKLLTTDGTNAAWTTTGVLTSLTSPASTNLTLGLGTGGTALTLASSTLAATFAGAVTATGGSGTIFAGADTVTNLSIIAFGDTSRSGASIYSNNSFLAINSKTGVNHIYLQDINNNPSATVNIFSGNVVFSQTGAATFAGAVTVATGNLVIGTAGNGIDFSADPSAAGMTSELLDDYEEGTWTPSIGGTATYTTQVGSYTKIGRQVTLWFDLTINVLGTGSTQFISGVPFVPALGIGYHSGTVYWESIAINEIALNVVCQESSGTIWFIGKSAAGASVDNVVAVIGTGARFRGTLTYNV